MYTGYGLWISTYMTRLYAKCIPTFTDCTIAELEKLGDKYRLALRVAKDPRWERVKCSHKGTYADDCLVDRVSLHQNQNRNQKKLLTRLGIETPNLRRRNKR